MVYIKNFRQRGAAIYAHSSLAHGRASMLASVSQLLWTRRERDCVQSSVWVDLEMTILCCCTPTSFLWDERAWERGWHNPCCDLAPGRWPFPHPVPPPRIFVTSPQSPICHQYKMAPVSTVNTVHRIDWDRQLRTLVWVLSDRLIS